MFYREEFGLDIKQFLSLDQSVSNQPFNLYPGGYYTEKRLFPEILTVYDAYYREKAIKGRKRYLE